MDTQSSAKHQKYERLVARARELRPVPTAVVHPCDDVSLGAAVEAKALGLIDPILVGPVARVRGTAERTCTACPRSAATISRGSLGL